MDEIWAMLCTGSSCVVLSFVCSFVRAQLTGNCGGFSILLRAFFVIRDSTATLEAPPLDVVLHLGQEQGVDIY